MKATRKWLLSAVLGLVMALGLIPSAAFAGEGDVAINETNFPDSVFRTYIEKNCDKDGDKVLSESEIANATNFYFYSWTGKISSLKGIEYFTALESLSFSGHNVTAVDLSHNKALKTLDCSRNPLTSLDLSSNKALESLTCGGTNMTSLDVSGNTALTRLSCQGSYSAAGMLTSLKVNKEITNIECQKNQLTSLDLSGCTELTSLSCQDNQLTTLDVTDCKKIQTIWCSNNQLTDLKLDGITTLQLVSCGYNKLETLDVSANKNLSILGCENNGLKSLNVNGCDNLTILQCEKNALTELDFSNNSKLETIWCFSNQLTSLDLSKIGDVEDIMIDYDTDDFGKKVDAFNVYAVTVPSGTRTLDLTKLPGNFDVTKASNWKGGSVEGNILTVDKDVDQVSYTYDCGKGQSATFVLTVTEHDHTFEWVIDKAATGTETGLKHEECTVCGEKRSENTVIPATGKNDGAKAEAKTDNAANTGDESNIALWIALLLVSGAAAGAVVVRKRKLSVK